MNEAIEDVIEKIGFAALFIFAFGPYVALIFTFMYLLFR
jgi:hypothetical protein